MNFQNSNITYKNHSYIDFASDAGILSINTSRKEVIFTFQDLEMGEGTFKMGLSHTYSNYSHLGGTNVGNNWKLNIQQYIKKYDGTTPLSGFTTNDYIYVDGSGYIHKFVKYDTNKYLDENGTGMTLHLGGESYIENTDGSRVVFDSSGRLSKIVTKGPAKQIVKLVEYNASGNIKKMYDSRKLNRYFEFNYNNGLIKNISIINDSEVHERIYYQYENNNLTGIYHYINNALAKVSLFKYDSNNNLILTSGTNNGIALKISYTSSGINVSKGISRLLNFNNDSLRIGVKTNKTISGEFISSENSIYCGLKKSKDILDLDFEHTLSAKFEVETFNEIIDLTTFSYTSVYTDIYNIKNIKYRYYYNTKGFTTGVFELDENNNMMTLNKDSGTRIMGDVDSTYTGLTINKKKILTRDINTGVACVLNDTDETFKNGPSFNTLRKNVGSIWVNYLVSFWLKLNIDSPNYVKANLKVSSFQDYEEYKYVDSSAINVWQYVTIPFSIENSSKTYDFTSMIINISSDKNGTYEISNITISQGEKSGVYFAELNIDINKYDGMQIVLNDDTTHNITFDYNNYLTGSDVFISLKNKSINENIDLVYSSNTKRISNVKKLSLIKNNQIYEVANIRRMSYKSYLANKEYYISKTYHIDNSYIEENIESPSDTIENKYDHQGRIIRNINSYGLETNYEYDDYGNLLSVTETNSNIPDYKHYTRYNYDNELENGMYRECLSYTHKDDTTVKIKNSNKAIGAIDYIQACDNYRQNFQYDLLNRISDLSIIYGYGKVIRNRYQYDYNGRLSKVSDSDNYNYKLEYDNYGFISKYIINDNYNDFIIKEKSVSINTSNYGGDVNTEINKLTNSTIVLHKDKYSRPIKQIITEGNKAKNVTFSYQEMNESPSLSNVSSIIDECDNSKTTYTYDDSNNISKCIVSVNNTEYLTIENLNSSQTKYITGDTGLIFSTESNANLFEPKIAKTKVLLDDDEFTEVEEYTYEYEYDNLSSALSKKTAKNQIVEYSYLPTNNSKYYSTNLKTCKNTLKCIGCILDYNYTYNYNYDLNQNIIRIEDLEHNSYTLYSYDKLNRLKSEYNSKQIEQVEYSYLNDDGKDINRLTKVFYGSSKIKDYKYDNLNRLTHYYFYNVLKQQLFYDGNNLNPYQIKVNDNTYNLKWTRNNLLSKYGNIEYTYNYKQNRMIKKLSNKTIKYYYDGTKLLGEDHSDNIKIRYIYDITGIVGARYKSSTGSVSNYEYIKDGQNNVVGIIKQGQILVEYTYDSFGQTIESNKSSTDPFVNVNPIRYKSLYFDIETGLYYNNGRYYNPITTIYLDSMDIENINPSNINGLNLYSYGYMSSNAGMISSVALGGVDGGSYFTYSDDLSIKFPSQNLVSLGMDLTASMAGAFSVLKWTMKNPEFYEFWYSAWGLTEHQVLSSLKSPMTKFSSVVSCGLVAYDTYTDVMGHINAGDSWQITTASGLVTAGVGAFNVWASAKIGAIIGGYIGGVPGFIIGTAAGVVVGIVINGVFYTEINGKSIAGHIEDGIEWFFEWIS